MRRFIIAILSLISVLSTGDAQGDSHSPEEQFTVEIIGDYGSTSGDVTYLESGQYQVDYNVLKAGTYLVHVKTGGTDIYCGLGEENKCSPYSLTVLPGATLASNCEVESSFDPVDNLVEARAGEIGKLYLQAKDAFGNNRISGGDDVIAKFKSTANSDIQYRGNVLDREDGSYFITYSIPLAGSYLVSITVGGESVKYCVGPSGERWDSRQYDGISVYSSPSYCSLDDDLHLNVIHRELHGVSSTLVDEEGLSGLSSAIVGVETGFVIESRDKFGNLRSGSSTSNIDESGDGMSDAFLVSLVAPSGHNTITSTAVEILACTDSSVSGYFRLSYGGQITDDIPHDLSGPAMQVVLSSIHGNDSTASVEVSRSDVNGNYQWEITFTDHLELWSLNPLSVLPGSDGFSSVYDKMSVLKQPFAGIYPVRYTLWEKGLYELSVISGTTLVSGSSYTVEVANGTPQASSSSAFGNGLEAGVAGESSSFEVRVRDRRQSEIQSIKTSATVIEFIDEVQQIQVLSNLGETFRIEFRGQNSDNIEVGLSTLADIAEALEALHSIGQVNVSSNGSSVIQSGDMIDVEFLTEHGSLDLMKSNGPEVITTVVEGEAPYRAERHAFYCDADGGYVILSFKDRTATIEFNDDIESVISKLSLLFGNPVSIVDLDSSVTTICNSIGKVLFVDFQLELGDVEPVNVSFDALENGSISIFGDGEGHQGAVNGVSAIMGHFSLTHDGETTTPISVDATDQELKVALENLPSVGSVSVTKDMFGIRRGKDGQNIVPGTSSLFSIWSITFADDSEDGCHTGSWDKCPANIGDVAPLVIDASMLAYEIGATQQQSAPSIENFEVKKGSAGNLLDDVDGQSEIHFSLSHNMMQGVGIELQEVHTIACAYSTEALDASGSFGLEILNKRILVDAQASMSELKAILRGALGLTHPVYSAGSTHGTVCHFDPSNPVTAVTKLAFAKENGPIPHFYVDSEQNVAVTTNNLVDAVDKIEYLGGGRHIVTYTPTISGHYSASVQLNNEDLWTDLSAGVVINPAEASAHHCTHDSNLVAVAGNEHSFAVVARDRFGNQLSSPEPNETSLVISLTGDSDTCADTQRHDNPNATIEELNIGSPDGHYKMAYTPSLAGLYRTSIMVRSRGGLLATYFKNQDFSQPVYGNTNHNFPPYHETPWCAGDEPVCDSTHLDNDISFDWGFESPLAWDPSFPMDSFSITWDGEIRVDVAEEYTFTVHLNGGVRFSIGEQVVIDKLLDASAESVSSFPIMLMDDIFYRIKVEYVHSIDEARIQLFWESASMPRQIVPSSVFHYTRHISGSSPSPFSVHSAPGDIDISSIAQGEGLTGCVSLEECSFVIQTKDLNQNNRYNDGSDPGFEITISGNGGWAGEGRINSVVSSSPVVISDATVTSNDWQYIGEVDVTHRSDHIASKTSFVGTLLRGDQISVDGTMYTVSSTGTFDSTSVPLLSTYLGPAKKGVSVYKASASCMSGTHTVKYTPTVRGSYLMDVKLPMVTEIQRVTTSPRSHPSLSGAFTLTYHGQLGADPLVSGSIDFNANSEEFQIALESIETIGSVAVTLHDCNNPAISCSWDVTFLSVEGDVNMLVPNKVQLGGDIAEVFVEELVKGRRPKSITGFPRTIDVSPGQTSPSRTTAYGRGIVSATAGDKSTFVILPKDSSGNDRLAGQSADLFAVYIYPEEGNEDGSFPIIEGGIDRANDGFYTVDYVPKTSGFHTVAVVQAVSTEEQIISTGYNTKARGGTFTIKLGQLSTPPISWDADEVTLKNALDSSMENISTFGVEKKTHGLFNYKYIISFESLLGDVPNFVVGTSDLIGNANDWDVVSASDGKFSHIKVDEPVHEIQSIKLVILDPSSLVGTTFSLAFMGQSTDPIPWDANEHEVLQKLEMLSTVGDILVSLDIDEATNDRSWHVTFNPYEGKSANSLFNFGNLPPFKVINSGGSISVLVDTIENGISPFQVFVSPAESSSGNMTAHDHPGVRHFEGLSTAVYMSDSHFFIQSRDEFSNEIQEGPLREVQIIETTSSSQIGGYFEVSMFEATIRVHASAFTSELEKSLQSIPGVGSLEVSSKSAKDLVIGKTVAVTKGLDTIIPSEELDEFIVGDWIRIGDQDEGPLFSITEIADVTPFTVTLSSPYLGEPSSSSNIYQHGSSQNRKGYQYIVSFDAVLGDLPRLDVDGTLLKGADAQIEVKSCNWNVHQSIRTHAKSPTPIEGYFYLTYGTEQTRLLSVGTSEDELEDAILSDISSIHSLSVTHEQDHGLGATSWAIHLMSFDGDAQLFFAEGHLLSGGTVVAAATCPVASSEDSRYSVESVAGRRGEQFVAVLDGPSTVYGTIKHMEDGRYVATYNSPRVGSYSLSVQSAHFGGLRGEYFNNRWLYGSPTLTRVDHVVDFQWDNNDPITPTGKDFVSIRWTGYIIPAFNETYTFTAHVNDAVRLWIGDELLIDEYENEVDDLAEYNEFSASTENALKANQLVAIKIEYRENRGSAMIRLFWESISQPFAVIDRPRLHHTAKHIHGSPFEVIPQAIEPTSPTLCSLDITSWDSLEVSWSAPDDDGGNAVNKYLIESWDANEYGLTEKQQLRIKRTITGGSITLSMHSHSTNIPIGSSALELEELIESLPNVGDVEVLKTVEANYIVYDVEFLTNNSPVPVMSIDMLAATPYTERNEYCVCARSSATCDSGSPLLICSVDASREGSISTQSQEVIVQNTMSNSGGSFSHTIIGLEQSSSILDGFGVRVSAGNSEGFGIPCPSLFLKPKGPPLPPLVVELERVPSNPSSLALHFTSVTSPDDKGSVVNDYFIEWSPRPFVESGTAVFSATLSADSVYSNRLSSYNDVDKDFNYYLIENLTPGIEYHVRISAVNEVGTGPSSRSTPLSLAPGSKPTDLEDQSGVTVATIMADTTVSVLESSSTLRVSWRAPFSDNGFGISKYLIEYWVSNGVSEVQEIVLQSPNGGPALGTFTLRYGEDWTDSLSIDSTAEEVKLALESLSTIRAVRVWRSGSNPGYKWTVTFASEYPSVAGLMLSVEDTTKLIDATGGVPTLHINLLTPGVLPIGYNAQPVNVVDPLQTHYDYILTDLTAGQPYNIQVSSANQLGYGRPRASIPRELAPPVQKPSSPTNVILSVASSQSLEITFTKPESDGGDTVTLYRIEWDTDPAFDSLESSSLGSYSFVSPKNGPGCEPCTHQVTGLVKGQNYFVRVYAYNSHGYSVEPGLPTPEFLSPKTAPDPPAVVGILPQSDTAIQVSFPPSGNDGGAPVTKYKVEWNAMGFVSGMASTNSDHTALLYSPNNVQTITLSAQEDDLGGVFRIAFEGHSTDEISAKSTANDIKLELESLPTVGSTIVSRESITNGFAWAITFLTNHGNLSKYGPIESLVVSADPAALPHAFVTDTLGTSGTSLLGTGARLVVHDEVSAFKGYEQQTLTTQCATSGGILGGHFALSLYGARTNQIPFNALASELKIELETVGSVGTVKVIRRTMNDSINAFQWTVIFVDRLGNVPLLDVHDHLTCSDGSGSPLIFATENTQGLLPRMDGPYAGEVELYALDYTDKNPLVHSVEGLMRGVPYHFRVSAWNGAGESYGKTQYSTPSIMVPMDRPDPPSAVEMSSIDDSTIEITWDAALVKGGSHQISKFKVELAESSDGADAQFEDVTEGFNVEIAPEVQEIVLESSADDMGGHIMVHFMGESSSNISTDSSVGDIKRTLEGISTIGSVEVSIFSHTQDSMTLYGQRWVITFTSQNGNLPSMLVDTGSAPPSTIATGGSLLGSSSVVRVETVSDGGLPTRFVTPSFLSKDKTYTSRILAFNGHSWSRPAISRYAISPSKSAPSPPREVRVNVLSDTEIGVSWMQPLYSGGDSLAAYRLEWDSDAMFDHSSATVNHMSGSEDYYFVIKKLDPLESYFVRVMAYSAQGFSEPQMAVPLLVNMRTIIISLIETTGSVDFSETFVVELSSSDGLQRATNPISVYATSREVENELNLLGIIGAISVDREDRSTVFDSSGIETNFFDIRYAITLVGDDDIALSINVHDLGSITGVVEEEG